MPNDLLTSPEKRSVPSDKVSNPPFLVAPWTILAVFLQCAGWGLSAIHQLNAGAYAVVLACAALFLWWKRSLFRFGRIRPGRFKRIFPCGFLVLASLAILGGILHPPANYDGLAYRIPRTLHWLAEGHWHWIHAPFHRLNSRAPGWEWLAAPILAITHTYRWVFLINSVTYLMLPGLLFSCFTRLGITRRAAWYWMWLVPAGFCFLLQAGSIANDAVAATWSLAALDYALRAKQSRRLSDLWLSVLSAGLLTATKFVNAPLLLPWAIAIFPEITLFRKSILTTAAVAVCAATASFLPMTILNQKYCGDWSGLVLERGSAPPGGPLLLVPVNAVALTIQNFAPPIFPMANAWNSALERKMPKGMTERLERNFERRTAEFELNQLEVEESAGLGLGITTLLLLSFGWALARKRDSGVPARQDGSGFYWRCLLLSPWVSLLVFLVKCSVGDQSRLVAAYYPLLIPALLMSPFQERLVRARWWRALALCAVALSLAPLVVSPPRPLWPALSVLEKLDAAHSSKALLRRAHDVYSVYAQRSDAFAAVIKQLPEGLTVLGVIIFDDPEAALWLPIGSHRILHLMPHDTLSDLQQKKIEYVLVRPEVLAKHFPQSLDEWQTSMRAQRVTTFPLRLRAALGPVDWILFRVPAAD